MLPGGFRYCVLCFCIPSCLQNAHVSPASGGKKRKAITLEMQFKIVAQLQANVSVLSMLREAKLSNSVQ